MPICTILPARMIAMRSAIRSASRKSCVMKTIDFFENPLDAQEFILHLPPNQRVERGKRLIQQP